MSRLLELRLKISQFIGKYKFWFRTFFRFLAALTGLLLIRSQIWTISVMALHPLFLIAMAFIAMFIPLGAIAVLLSLYLLICIFAISPGAGAAALLVLLAMLFLYAAVLPASPGTTTVTLLSGMLNVSGIAAIPLGLFCPFSAVVPAAFGLLISGILDTVRQNYLVYSAGGAASQGTGELTFFLLSFLQNERFWLLLFGFIITALLVRSISRLPYAYAWLVSAATGVAVYVLSMMAGNVFFGITINPLRLAVTASGGFILALAGQIFSYLLDGSGAEYLQFEDEDYVYYVKAIPKYSLTPSDTSIKTITEHEHGE